ncbi:uncharacterized protein LOC110711402 [Chenopodium quinoa]|uniref:uncharacterized protein LOC110711402 n=1 Tax=Chenopodium quinoa TaxID=63459 RepID=UPI000B799B60|nr:uncharacterized protein LOC110711402 [Chenopodium quinoa]
MNEELQSKADRAEEAENLARLAEMKQLKDEDETSATKLEMQRMDENFRSFCRGLEQTVFPWIEEGQSLMKGYGADTIVEFKARIENKMKEEAESRQQLISDHESQIALIRTEAKDKQSELEAEVQKLKDVLEAEKKVSSKASSDLTAAEELLKTRIYTEAEYAEGYENGWKVARRLAFHLEPKINWDQAEAWSMDPADAHMYEASPAEVAFLAGQAENEEREKEAEKELNAAHRASSSADVDALAVPNDVPKNAEA